jgi:TrpR-related protein YerC/YecD
MSKICYTKRKTEGETMYKPNFFNDDIDLLLEALLTLKNKDEMMRFLEDICTIKEISDMGQRLKVAKMLSEKVPYHQIVEHTHASTATISRVNKSLIYGAKGYLYALERIVKK